MPQTTYRDVVHEIAADNYGYVTTRDAEDAGVPKIELVKLANAQQVHAHRLRVVPRRDNPAHPSR